MGKKKMMELVKFKMNGGVVTIQVTINGLVVWTYTYAEENDVHTGESSSPGPHIHTLGLPHELNIKVHNWDVHLGNSGQKQNYSVEINWLQDNNVIHTWRKAGTLNTGEAIKESGSALLEGV